MKKYNIILALAIALTFLAFVSGKNSKPDEAPAAKNSSTKSSFVIVELFTSQGCSSCPSADKLLSDLLDESHKSGQNFYPLSFHVSYWNYLGWKDPYSSEQFTLRQRDYGRHFGLNSVYTPQAVVNGKSEFIGSRRAKAKSQISKAFKEEKSTVLNTTLSSKESAKVVVDYTWSGASENHFLNVALVERHVQNYVPRGENNGRTLKHDNVVISFEQLDLKKKGTVTVNIPKKVNISNASVILYAQHKNNFKIQGASQVKLN